MLAILQALGLFLCGVAGVLLIALSAVGLAVVVVETRDVMQRTRVGR